MEIYYVIFICLIKNNELRIMKGHKVAFDILPQLKLAGFAIIVKFWFFDSKMVIC